MASSKSNNPAAPRRPIIGLYGRAGSGKSALASCLIDDHGFVPVKFADPLKDALRTMLFATDVDDVNVMIEGHLKEVPSPHLCGKTPRYAMQTLGTEWGRQIIGPEFWVNIARSSILYYADQAGVPVVVDDLRFPNELAMLKELGAVTVRVIRDDPKGVGEHPSEGALDDAPFDWEIYNNGTLESLYNAADSLVDLARS